MKTKFDRQNKVRDFSHFSQSRLNNDLIQIDWDLLSIVKGKIKMVYDKLKKLSNKHASLKKISKRKVKQSAKPWITKAIRRSFKIKNKLLYSGNKDKYKLYRVYKKNGAHLLCLIIFKISEAYSTILDLF